MYVSKATLGLALLVADNVPRPDLSRNQEYAPLGTAEWVVRAHMVLSRLVDESRSLSEATQATREREG